MNNLTIFVVEKVAIYRHGIVVVSDTEDGARAGIEAYLDNPEDEWDEDADGHHRYELLRLSSGEEPVHVATYRAKNKVYRGRALYEWKDPT